MDGAAANRVTHWAAFGLVLVPLLGARWFWGPFVADAIGSGFDGLLVLLSVAYLVAVPVALLGRRRAGSWYLVAMLDAALGILVFGYLDGAGAIIAAAVGVGLAFGAFREARLSNREM